MTKHPLKLILKATGIIQVLPGTQAVGLDMLVNYLKTIKKQNKTKQKKKKKNDSFTCTKGLYLKFLFVPDRVRSS